MTVANEQNEHEDAKSAIRNTGYQPISLPFDISDTSLRIIERLPGMDSLVHKILKDILFHAKTRRGGGGIINGKPGTGKSALARCIAESTGLGYKIVNCPDIFQTDEGESERKIEEIFKATIESPVLSIVILDEIDVIAAANHRTGVEGRVYSALVNALDDVVEKGNVFVLGITTRAHVLDRSVTRPGRLDRDYAIGLLTAKERYKVLNLLTEKIPFEKSEREGILQAVSKRTHGFVPTDLQNLCTQVALSLISSHKSTIAYSDFDNALQSIRPSALSEFHVPIPPVRFKNLYGVKSIIEDLQASVVRPFEHPEHFLSMGIAPPRGVLVYGPPGVGKTMLCCALAAETGLNFMHVEASQIRSKIVGESERNIAKMFAAAKGSAPSILFIDQIDVLAPRRGTSTTSENTSDRIVTGILTEMDGFFTDNQEVNVLLIAASNRPQMIDPALLRPGRLDIHVYMGPPDAQQRLEIFQGIASTMPLQLDDKQMRWWAEKTEGCSGADIENLCREAALLALRESIQEDKVTHENLLRARIGVRPSLLGYIPSHPYGALHPC
ncbi:uncharacterized protein VTP21DRAFT_2870 [Calcarisporiella thermophila]|uniref:uncharacterized protein n=1 Tax=Calcarisporiella thermophila TaxID=911321 RepID=UPI00374456FA